MGLTLVPQDLATPGHSFTFLGPNDGEECTGCPVRRLCFDLEPGARYQVQKTRDVTHPCNLHEGGRVRVVEVERIGFRTSMKTKRLRGTAATFVPVPCEYPDCKEWAFCHPFGVQTDVRYGIEEIGEAMDCPMDFKIKRVALKPL